MGDESKELSMNTTDDLEISQFSERELFPDNIDMEENSKGKSFIKTLKEQINRKMYDNKRLLHRLFLIVIMGALVLGNIFYILTLKPCYGTERECLEELEPQINYFLGCLLTSSLIFSIIFNLAIFQIIHRIIFPIIIILNLIFLCLIYDTGNTFRKHGGWNRIPFLFFISLFTLIIFLFTLLAKLIRKYPIIIILVVVLIIFAIFSINQGISTSCEGWDLGLKGKKIDNTKPYCHLIYPKYCYFAYLGRLLDISFILNIRCKNAKSYDIYNYVSSETKLIGYPRTEYYSREDRMGALPNGTSQFQMNVLNRLNDLEDPNIPQEVVENTEIIIDAKDREKPNVIIDVKLNKTAINLAKEYIKNRKNKPLVKNILIIFIDSLSRAHIYITMPKVVKFLEKYYENEDSSVESFQFFRYRATSRYTYLNLYSIFYGINNVERNRIIEKSEHFFPNYSARNLKSDYKEQGFIIGTTYDFCESELYDYIPNENKNLDPGRADHEGTSLFCDPAATDVDAFYSNFKGMNSFLRRCIYGKDGVEYAFEYGKDFWDKYKEMPKFLEIGLQDVHETTGQGSRYVDEHMANFLNNLDELDDTMILIYGDHGLSLSFVLTPSDDTSDQATELYLPSLFILFPKKALSSAQRHDLKGNENSLILDLDLYQTLQEVYIYIYIICM